MRYRGHTATRDARFIRRLQRAWGSIADEVRARAATLGFPLATAATPAGTYPALIEVYPHPALIHLLDRDFRVPYKVAKTTRYWRDATLQERIARLHEQHSSILSALGEHIVDPPLQLPGKEQIGSLASLKAYEDALDALVCAWVGIRYVQGDCRAFGDSNAAIWIPMHTDGRDVTTTFSRRA